MGKKKFTLLGGDKRNIALAKLLIEDGHQIGIYGFDNLNIDFHQCRNLNDALTNADIIIGPLPLSKENNILNTPFSDKKVYLNSILDFLTDEQLFIAGKIPYEFIIKLKERHLIFEDYFNREEMQVQNAIPTAEGAVQIAMEKMEITLNNSNAMVLGFGRIGKSLSNLLKGIGANVYTEARNYEDLAWIKNYGYEPVHITELEYSIGKMDVIFNTIPRTIIDKNLLSKLNKDSILIDLASSPGGVDLKSAKELDIDVITAGGLPGKVAPVTAASIIKDTIYNIMNERKV